MGIRTNNANNEEWPIGFNLLSNGISPSNNYKRILNDYELYGLLVKVFSNKVACIIIKNNQFKKYDPYDYFKIKKLLDLLEEKLPLVTLQIPELKKFFVEPIKYNDTLLGFLICNQEIKQSELNIFNTHLNNKISLIQEKFIRKKNDEFLKSLKVSINGLSRIGYEEGFNRFWTKLEGTLELLVNTYPAKHVATFALKSIYTFDKQLEMVASYGFNKKSYKHYKYNIERLDLNYTSEMLTSLENPKLLDNITLKGKKLMLSSDEDLIRVLPSPFSVDSTIIIWVKYDNSIWPRLLLPDDESNKLFDRLITSFYTVLTSSYSSLLSSHMLELIESSWRIFGHETAQISAAIDRLRKSYIESERIQKIDRDELSNIDKNLEGLVEQYNNLSLNTKALILGTPKLNCENFYLFGEFFFKWKNIYKAESGEKYIDIKTPLNFKSYDRPPIYADRILIEQVLYNLINNAVKYGREGTNIHIDYKVDGFNQELRNKIEITNYSSIINDKRVIWELFGRDTDNPEEGLGIGLYISSQIIKAHKGTINLIEDFISPYNVVMLQPIIDNYDVISKEKIDEYSLPKKEKLIDELNKLKSEGRFSEVVNIENNKQVFKPKLRKALFQIKKPTYSIKFQIKLPVR